MGLPPLVSREGERAQLRFIEFFASNIRNAHTRRAYARAASSFLAWCEGLDVRSLAAIQPLHVAAWIERMKGAVSVPTVKQNLAAVRHLFDWLVIGQVVPTNPAASVRGPRHVVRRGKTPSLSAKEARELLDSIDTTTHAGLRDRALIALMAYSFARIGAALSMRVDDVYTQERRLWVRLHEKNGKDHEMPCHHHLERYLAEYLDATGLGSDPRRLLFPRVGRYSGLVQDEPLRQAEAHVMVRRRAKKAGIATRIGNHTFRATGITAYLEGGGDLETAAAMANHASTRTTQLYDRRPDKLTLDEIERIHI